MTVYRWNPWINAVSSLLEERSNLHEVGALERHTEPHCLPISRN